MQQTSEQKQNNIYTNKGGTYMFKKMKHMKNEKGLTLVELLAVIVVLAIVAAIAIPSIGNIINDSRDKAILSEASNILSGAKLAHTSNKCGDPVSNVVTCSFDILDDFVDGITLADTDIVTYNTLTKEWTITYTKLANIKDKATFSDGFTGTNQITTTESQLNINLTK